MSDGRLSLRAWLWTAGAWVAFLIASFTPLPGVDQEVLRAMAAGSGGLLGLFNVEAPMLSLVNQGMGLLILVRGALRLIAAAEPDAAREVRWARVGFAVYVVLSFVVGLVTTIWLESVLLPGADSIVVSPGWGSRLLIALTLTGGAVVVWLLASVISRRGVGQGPLVLFGAAALLQGVGELAAVGPDLQRGDGAGVLLLGRLGMLIGPAILLVALWAWRPERWPIRVVRGLRVVSPIDLLCLPPLAAAIGVAPAGMILANLSLPGAIGAPFAVLQSLAGVIAAVLVVVWLKHRAGATGRGSAGWLLAAAVGCVLGLLVAATSLLSSGAITDALSPGPYAGDGNAVLVLEADGGDGAADAPVLVQRFADIGLDVTVRAAEHGRIRLEVHDVGDLHGALEAVLPPRAVSLRWVDEDQGPLVASGEPPVAGLVVAGFSEPPVWGAATAEALEPLRALLPEDARSRAFVECGSDNCQLRLLADGPALIGPRDIADARVQFDDIDGRPNVSLEMRPRAAERFGQQTGQNIGRLLAILVDDRIVSSPKVVSAIPGGRAMITLGASQSMEDQLREAQALAAALRSGPLGSRWAVASER